MGGRGTFASREAVFSAFYAGDDVVVNPSFQVSASWR
jgi:hypothetical protein